jgi:hypothetical protein
MTDEQFKTRLAREANPLDFLDLLQSQLEAAVATITDNDQLRKLELGSLLALRLTGCQGAIKGLRSVLRNRAPQVPPPDDTQPAILREMRSAAFLPPVIPEETMRQFREGFQEEHYLVEAIKRYLLTPGTRGTLLSLAISIEDILNGRVGSGLSHIARNALEEWNRFAGEKIFMPEVY